MPFPSPDTVFPVQIPDGTPIENNVFLQAVIDHPRIEVGAYSYASDFNPPPRDGWASRLAPYLFAISKDKLVIAKFVQIAHGTQFVTQDANHKRDGISTFPFAIHDPQRLMDYARSLPAGRDTVVGHDIWFGMNALVLPGAQIGNGVIVGAGAVVHGVVPDYAVVTGNPARLIRMRFESDRVGRLNALAWWNWPIEWILRHEELIIGGDVDALEEAAP